MRRSTSAFLNAELARLAGASRATIAALCARCSTPWRSRARCIPGQRNNLDALCKRYGIDNSQRELHGALLDARILADVYLAMTGGQANLTLARMPMTAARAPRRTRTRGRRRGAAGLRIAVLGASDEELGAHEQALQLLDKASGGSTVWRKL